MTQQNQLSLADDPTIDDADLLLRRILPSWVVRLPDGTTRAGSNAFQDNHTGQVSVSIAKETTLEHFLRDHPGHYIAAIHAGCPRSYGLGGQEIQIRMTPLTR